MAATPKSDRMASVLADNLNMRLGAGVAVKSYDASGDAVVTLTIGSGDGSVQAIVRIKPIASIQKDSLGNTQTSYGPHVTQVLFDTDASVGTTSANKLAVLGEIFKFSTKVEWYDKDPADTGGTDVIAIADIDPTNLKGTFDPLPWLQNEEM